MSLHTRRRIDTGFGLTLLVLCLVSLASLASIRALHRAQRDLVHSEQQLLLQQNVLADLMDAELGQRGFLLTGNLEFLEPYEAATASLTRDLGQLRRLTADDPEQLVMLDRLQSLAARRMAVLRGTVQLAAQGRFAEGVEIVRGEQGKELMDSVRAVVTEMERAERRQRVERVERVEATATRTTWVVVLASVLAVLGVGVSRGLVVRDLRRRERAERALSQSERSLRELYQVASAPEAGFEEKLVRLLEMGCRRYGVRMGAVAHIHGEQYRVLQAVSHDGSLRAGQLLPLGETFCQDVYRGAGPVALERAGDTPWAQRPCYAARGVETYLGVPLHLGADPFGVLYFADPDPRDAPFSAGDRDLLLMMAQWVSEELQRRRVEEALRGREERYRSLVESANDIIYTTDLGGRFTYVNPVAVRTMGYPEEALIGTLYLDLIRPDHREAAREFYEAQLRDRVASTY